MELKIEFISRKELSEVEKLLLELNIMYLLTFVRVC